MSKLRFLTMQLGLLAIMSLTTGCDLNDLNSGNNGYGNNGYGNNGYGNGGYNGGYDRYDNRRDDYYRDRERVRDERHELEHERRDAEEERRRLQRERDSYRAPPPPPPQRREERCPSGYSPSENKCSQEERRRGCKDMRLPGGLGCVHR